MATKATAIPLESYATFGALLRYLRRRARLTQRELGIAVGYSEGHICHLENNSRAPDLTALAALFVPVLELANEPEIVARLLQLAALAAGKQSNAEHRLLLEPLACAVAPTRDNSAQTNGGKTSSSSPHNLPASTTPLLGRAADIHAVCTRLCQPEVRLLTLTGPPGVGKTRLSLAAAWSLLDQFADGVFLIELASLNQPELVTHAIAAALGVSEKPTQPLIEQLQQTLRHQTKLLVLDNFEHLLPAAPLLASLLAAASRLKVLVTSRTVLHLSGEHEFPVPPLGVPDLAQLPPLDELAQNPAVRLFQERAQAVNPRFALNAKNRVAVAAICVRLDGLPLALELAAARIKLLDPQTLLTRLHQRLPLLTQGAQDRPTRHQTLKAAIDWSYKLLPPNAQTLFARLGIFVGGCTLAALETVCGQKTAQEAAAFDYAMLDELQSLIDASLVQVQELAGEQRITLLETLREYAVAQLSLSAEQALLHQRHALYFLNLADAAASQQQDKYTKAWFERLERDHDNLRTALDWLLATDPESAQQLVVALGEFWHKRGYFQEGRRWLSQTLAQTSAPTRAHAKALELAGHFALAQDDYAAARAQFEASLQLCRQLADGAGQVGALRGLGWVEFVGEAFPCAVARFEEALRLSRTLGDSRAIANLLYAVSFVHIMNGDVAFYPLAQAYLAESLQLHQALNDPDGSGAAREAQAALALMTGDYARAVALAREALALYRAVGNEYTIPGTAAFLGDAERLHGDLASAFLHTQEAYDLYQTLQVASGRMTTLRILGQLEQTRGHLNQAVQHYRASLQLALELKDSKQAFYCLAGLSRIAFTLRQYTPAAKLLAAAQALLDHLPAFLAPADQAGYRQLMTAVLGALGEEDFNGLWAEGQAMALTEAVNLVLV